MICILKNSRIFVGELTLQPSFNAYFIAAFFMPASQNSINCCFPMGSRYKNALLTVANVREQQFFLFFNILNNPTMQPSVIQNASRSQSMTPQSTPAERHAAVSTAHETCEKFIAYISERYPQLNQLRYRIRRKGKNLYLRARYRRRAIHAQGQDFEKTMSCFLCQLIRKVSLEKYYPSRAGMKENKPLEPFLIALRCEIRQKGGQS